MSVRVKICGCGHHNEEHAAFCGQCGQPVLEVIACVPPSANPKETAGPGSAKVCPACGATNENYALLCSAAGCGADLSRIPATTVGEKPSQLVPPHLWMCVGGQTFECRDGDILGREGTVACQVFGEITTVSRQHVRFNQQNGGWFIIAMAHVRNTTRLDGLELPRGAPQALTSRHQLQLSTQCQIQLIVADAQPSVVPEIHPPAHD